VGRNLKMSTLIIVIYYGAAGDSCSRYLCCNSFRDIMSQSTHSFSSIPVTTGYFLESRRSQCCCTGLLVATSAYRTHTQHTLPWRWSILVYTSIAQSSCIPSRHARKLMTTTSTAHLLPSSLSLLPPTFQLLFSSSR